MPLAHTAYQLGIKRGIKLTDPTTWSSIHTYNDLKMYLENAEYEIGKERQTIVQLPYSNNVVDLSILAKNAGMPFPLCEESVFTYHFFGHWDDGVQNHGPTSKNGMYFWETTLKGFRGEIYDESFPGYLKNARCTDFKFSMNPLLAFYKITVSFTGRAQWEQS